MGKTRLIWELEKYLDGLPETFTGARAAAIRTPRSSYSPLVEAVKADARISDDDPPASWQRSWMRASTTWPMRRPACLATRVAGLLGLRRGRALAQEELFEAWRLYWRPWLPATRWCWSWRTSTGLMT